MSDVEQTAQIRGCCNLVIQAGREVHLGAEPKLHLTNYETRRGRIESDADRLTAYARAIAMIGRDPEMRALSDWLGSARPIAVRVLTGPAGTGKARLALELVDRAIGHDWDAGFVTDRELARFAAQENLAAWGWQNPTLIVVDYAAARAQQLAVWLAELADNDSPTPLRLMLLERHADPSAGWWREAFGHGSGDALAVLKLLDPAEPVAVPSLGDTEVRREILGAILAQVGSDLRPPKRGADPDFDGRLARVSWGGEPLFLQMAGVLAAGSGFGHLLTLSRAELAFALGDREIARIEKIAAAHAMEPSKDFVVHMAAYATLCQGLTRGEALPAIAAEETALLRASAGDPPQVFNLLASALPGDADAIAPVLPDMIGEAVLLRAGIDADTVIRAAASHRPQVAATVMRTAQDYAPWGELAPLDWLDRLVEPGAADLAALMEIANALPRDTLVLRTRAAKLTARIAEIARAMPDDGPMGQQRRIHATALTNLANRLSDAGKREAALDIARQAVSLYRALAAANPDAFTVELVISLGAMHRIQSALSRSEEALATIAEAPERLMPLFRALPAAHGPLMTQVARSYLELAKTLGREPLIMGTVPFISAFPHIFQIDTASLSRRPREPNRERRASGRNPGWVGPNRPSSRARHSGHSRRNGAPRRAQDHN